MKFSLFTVMVPAWSPEEVVKKLKEYGYDGVEWRVRDVPKAAPDPMPARDQLFWQYNRATLDIDNIAEDAARAKLFTVERLCKKYGVQANLEIHMNTIIPSASAAYRLIEGMDEDLIGVVFDAGNMVYEGFENYQFGMELLDRHVHHVHIKDSTWAPNKEGKLAPGFAEIGKGVVNYEKLFDALHKIGYDNYLSFEDFSVSKSDDDKLRDNLAFIKEKLG